MPQLCLYFQLHQPFRLSEFSVLAIGKKRSYFEATDDDLNREIFSKVSGKSYRPMLSLLAELVTSNPDFKVALSCSGVFLEQAAAYDPEVTRLLQTLAKSSQVEFLAETYYHSLSALYSDAEFTQQVKAHSKALKEVLGVTPTTFRNTELIYVNELAGQVQKLGFAGILTEAVPRYLHGRPLTQVFRSVSEPALPLLLKHAQLSDDLAFRFSNRDWEWYPLTVDRYLEWVRVYDEQQLVNIFMDFETFGEHQWADTGIFEFFKEFVRRVTASDYDSFVLPREVIGETEAEIAPVYDVPVPISWADIDRDLTAWTENELQQDCLAKVYDLEEKVLASKDERIINDWRRLQTSDHFYYMCIKWSSDGDVHAYFSPYDSPYEAYRRFSIVLADLQERLL